MIIKLTELLSKFDNITANRQNDCVEHLLKKAKIKLHVYNSEFNIVLVTTSFSDAYGKAFNNSKKQGHFEASDKIKFYKPTGSLVLNTDKDLFKILIDYLNISPNVLYKELGDLKFIW